MPKITVLPHPKYCPQGIEYEAREGDSLIRGMMEHGARIEHACEMSCACATCHVIVREGFNSLEEPTDREYDCLDRAWGSGPLSRLACQVKVADADLVIEIPKYTRNQVSEED